MPKKIAVSLDFPVRWKLIANGERVIEQTGPDEIHMDIRDGEIRGESWLYALTASINEARREMRQSKRRKKCSE